MMIYLPIAWNSSNASVVHSKWDVEPDNRLATLNVLVDICWDVSLGGSSAQEQLNLLQESWLTILI
jgi:hypothetical protein